MAGPTLCRDHMSGKVFTVKISNTVDQTIHLLDSKNLTGVPVVSGDGRLIGLVSLLDVVVAASLNLFTSKLCDLPPQLAVTKPVISLPPDAPIKDAILLIVKKRIGRVIIVDEEKRPIGVLSRKDLLRYYARQRDNAK